MAKNKGTFIEVRPIEQGTTDLDIAFWQEQRPDAMFGHPWGAHPCAQASLLSKR